MKLLSRSDGVRLVDALAPRAWTRSTFPWTRRRQRRVAGDPFDPRRVLDAIDACASLGLNVRVNCVVLRGKAKINCQLLRKVMRP